MRFFKFFPVETSAEPPVDDTVHGEPDHYETDCDDYPSDSDEYDEYSEKYIPPSRSDKQYRNKRTKSSRNSGRVNTKAMKVARGDKYFVDVSSDVPDSSDDSLSDDDIDEFGYSAEDRRLAELNMIEYFEWYEDLNDMFDYIFDKLFPDESYLPRSSFE